MRTYRGSVVLLVAVILCLLPAGSPLVAQGGSRKFVPGELIIQYHPGNSAQARARVRGAVQGRLKRQHLLEKNNADESYLEVVTLPTGAAPDQAAMKLANDPAVRFAEPNWIYTHAQAPNDPLITQMWGLHNTGQVVGDRAGTPDADIDALEAWSRTTGSPAVYVAVLDEGIDVGHEDLRGTGGPIWRNPYDPADGVDNDRNGYVDDVHGFDFAAGDNSVYDGIPGDLVTDMHGTHVAGTIGARANNGLGIAGLNWDVRIIPAKFLTADGGATSDAIRAIDYIVDLKTRHGLNIVAINASWGGAAYSQALLEAIARAARADILFIAAAGNGADDYVGDDNDSFVHYPANYDTTALAGYDSVISVAATGLSDTLGRFSNFGARSVDLGAPGVWVLSTTPQNRYDYCDGTSMAAPHVTGAAALVNAATGIVGRDLRARLLSSVDRVAGLQGRSVTGGRLNVLSALGGSAPPQSSPPLQAPWRSSDIGAVGAAGRATAAGSSITVDGAGADVWGTADAFQFAYQPLTGDGSIIARVASIENVAAWTKAGVMIRASLSAGAAHGFLLVSPGKGVAFQRRPSDGGTTIHTAGTLSKAPRWVKISRSGATVTASESADGSNWTVVGSSSIALSGTAYVGLAVSSHIAGTIARATFDNVSVQAGPAASAVWSSRDIGAVGLAGTGRAGSGTYTVSGSGADIWGSADQLQYMYQPLTGDGTIVARVASIQNTNAWVKAGVMIRASLTEDAAHALMLVTPGGTKGLAFQRRVTAGGLSTHTSGGAGTAPSWVKLVRAGSTITAYRSADGTTWTWVGSDTVPMDSTVYAGLAVSSHDNTVLATATFDQVSVTAAR